MQDVFNFFGRSLNRWRELQIESEKDYFTLKKLCTTRRSSRINVVRAVRDRYTYILKVLTRISLTSDKTSEQNTASTLRKDLDSFEFFMFIVLWERILRAFNSSSKELQSPEMDLSAASRLLNCTKNELQHIRESWDSVAETATVISRSRNIKVSLPSSYGVCTRNAKEYDTAFEDHSHSFKVNAFYRILDIALYELNTRFKGHQSVMQLFSFLYPQSLATCSNDEIRSAMMNIM